MQKRLLDAQRLRQMPRQFSWIDQRLIRDRHIERCSARSWGLYLMLVSVGDAQGLSFYSDRSIQRLLSLTPQELAICREELQREKLLAYEAPLYQVLDLQPRFCGMSLPLPSEQRMVDGESRTAGEVFQKWLGGYR